MSNQNPLKERICAPLFVYPFIYKGLWNTEFLKYGFRWHFFDFYIKKSRENQLKKIIEDSVRFDNCQFIILAHLPFLLKLIGAKIYDLDEASVTTKNWTDLSNLLVYYNSFKVYEDEFKKK